MDILFYNGKIVSMDSSCSEYEAIGIKDGTICFLGTNVEAQTLCASQKIDLEHKLLLPGFIDSHLHFINYAFNKNFMPFSFKNIASLKDLKLEFEQFIIQNNVQPGQWIIGRGYNENNLVEQRFFTKEEMNFISAANPIFFIRACSHEAKVNDLAMNLILNLDKNKLQMENINLDTNTLSETACRLCYEFASVPSIPVLKEYIHTVSKELNSHGITSIHSDDFQSLPGKNYSTVIKAYCELRDENKLTIRVNQQCGFATIAKLKEFIDHYLPRVKNDSFYKLGPIKIILDGTLGARTASMVDSYSDDKKEYGILNFSKSTFREMATLAHNNYLQLLVHGIGDNAINIIIDTFKSINENLKRDDHRHTIVHAQFTNYESLKEMQRFHISANIQPIFLEEDMKIAQLRVGESRLAKAYAFKTMLNMGINLSGSSDAPVESFSVLENIFHAVTRKKKDLTPNNGWLPQEKLSVKEAVSLFTTGAAYASFEENIKGSLEVGKKGDLVILSENIFEIPEDTIKDVKVIKTVVDGKIVFNI